jgi:hypothetical protein
MLALLERLLEVHVDHKVRIYRKIAQVYAVSRNYATFLRYLEQAAEYRTQGEKNGVSADALWIEAAQTAIDMEEFGKAHGSSKRLRRIPRIHLPSSSYASYRFSTDLFYNS